MSRLPRPSISHSLKVEVALRQLRLLDAPAATMERTERRIGDYLERLLFALQIFLKTPKKLELHRTGQSEENPYGLEYRGCKLDRSGTISELPLVRCR